MKNIMQKCHIDPLPWTDFIDISNGGVLDDDDPETEGPERKVAREDSKFKDDHLVAFRNHGLSWPPTFPPHLHDVCRGLGQRQREVIYFLDATTEVGPEPNFADINMSLGYVMRSIDVIGKDFFKTRFPNLTGQSTIYTRWHREGFTPGQKILSGVELMQVIGWDRLMYQAGVPPEGNGRLLTSLSGNAFSGFSIGIVALALRIASQLPAAVASDNVEDAESESHSSGNESPGGSGVDID